MAAKAKNECTKHHIVLCRENKLLVKIKQAEMNHQSNISAAINQIIKEWKTNNYGK